ncbi:MAG: hypothetical protein AAFU54_26610 [Chloroflexota bacterium]
MQTLLSLLIPALMMSAFTLPLPQQATEEPLPATEEPANPDDTDADGVLNEDDLCDGAIPGATGADDTGCPTEFDPYVDLTFDHDAHELWYGRYWTGECAGVPGICFPGDPKWFTVTEDVVAQVPEAQQGVVRNRMWAVGRAVGHEWASDPDLNDKQIFTRQLRGWGRDLERADDVLATLTEIENEVCGLLGADAFAGGFSTAAACQPAAEPAATEEAGSS